MDYAKVTCSQKQVMELTWVSLVNTWTQCQITFIWQSFKFTIILILCLICTWNLIYLISVLQLIITCFFISTINLHWEITWNDIFQNRRGLNLNSNTNSILCFLSVIVPVQCISQVFASTRVCKNPKISETRPDPNFSGFLMSDLRNLKFY